MLFIFNIFVFGYFFINILEKLNNTYNYNKIYTLTENLPINNSLIMLYTDIKTNNPFLNNIILFLSSCILFCLYNFFLFSLSDLILSITNENENNNKLIINELLNEHHENIIENDLFQLILNTKTTNNENSLNTKKLDNENSLNTDPNNENSLNTDPNNENSLNTDPNNENSLNTNPDNENLLNTNPNNENLLNTDPNNENLLNTHLLNNENLLNANTNNENSLNCNLMNVNLENKNLVDDNLINEDEILDISEIEFNNKGNEIHKIDEIKVIKICKKKVV
jgi:hypothetical protein